MAFDKLIFEDHFDGDTIDRSKWNFEIGFIEFAQNVAGFIVNPTIGGSAVAIENVDEMSVIVIDGNHYINSYAMHNGNHMVIILRAFSSLTPNNTNITYPRRGAIFFN